LSAWTESTPYPTDIIAQSCVTSSTQIYCVGGILTGGTTTDTAYYAGVSPSGLGAWQAGGLFPQSVSTECVATSGAVYCVGGYDSTNGPTATSYYAPITVFTSSTTASSANSTTSSSS
jgi:hypothetical protein